MSRGQGVTRQARQLGALVVSNALLIGVSAVLVLAFAFFVTRLSSYSEQSDNFRSKVIEFDLELAELQAQIGFDGMIHNFKNCVIRPAEPENCAKAEANAARALELMDDLERVSGEIGAGVEFSDTRAMVLAYTERARAVPQLQQQGLSLAQIDARVRYDDAPAAQEIRRIQILAKQSARDLSDEFRRAAFLQSLGGLLLVALLFLTIVGILHQRSRFEQARVRGEAADRLSVANQRLAEANSALEQFASVASHDLKAPVRHMALFADAIRQEADGKEPITGFAGDITVAAREMGGMIDSLLTFSKTGFRDPECERFATREMLAEAVSGLDSQIAVSGARIDYEGVPATLFGDRQLLRQAFRNVLANSLKYVARGTVPDVKVRGERDVGMVRFAISDNGIGIPPQYADAVFRPLRRLHGADSEYEGSGLGLALVRTILRAHGGDAVIDTGYSGGTRVILTIDENALESGS